MHFLKIRWLVIMAIKMLYGAYKHFYMYNKLLIKLIRYQKSCNLPTYSFAYVFHLTSHHFINFFNGRKNMFCFLILIALLHFCIDNSWVYDENQHKRQVLMSLWANISLLCRVFATRSSYLKNKTMKLFFQFNSFYSS